MKSWREASSLIVIARKSNNINLVPKSTNYNILFQKRLEKASSFANSIVFPGGVTEKSDFNDNWLDYIKSCGIKNDQFDVLHKDSKLSQKRNVGLRIAAIRETFEELGILLCNNKNNLNLSPWASAIKDFDVQKWQMKVHQNSDEFLQLCQALDCYPNIWALTHWNNWLTPPSFKSRFGAAFFITAFDEVPQVRYDETEVAGYKWATVEDVLEQSAKGELDLMPPQEYELQRLLKHKDIDQLVRYAAEIHVPDKVYCPVHLKTETGIAAILPGDDLYPKDFDVNKNYDEKLKVTLEELRMGCSSLHRMEKTAENWLLVSNLQI